MKIIVEHINGLKSCQGEWVYIGSKYENIINLKNKFQTTPVIINNEIEKTLSSIKKN